MTPVALTVQLRRDANPQSARISLSLAMDVRESIEAIVGALQLPESENYKLFYQRTMLDSDLKLSEAGVQPDSILQLVDDDTNATYLTSTANKELAAIILQRLGGSTSPENMTLPIPATLTTSSNHVFTLKRTRALIGRADERIGYPPDAFDVELTALDPARSVSRPHALIMFQNGAFMLRDLYSRHGVLINGEKLAASGAQQIYDGDVLQIGAVIVAFHF